MVAIKNKNLQKQFEQFSKLESEKEKKTFWKNFEKEFESIEENEKENMRQAWAENVDNIEGRLKEIGKHLDKEVKQISIYPSNPEEAQFIETLLAKMKIRFEVG